jgi:predicted Rossmann fold flavoprotein
MGTIAIIGGGAAGFFAAISAKEANPTSDVIIFEKSSKVLSKVRISGGGRCNVTNACFDISDLAGHYPRGERFLKKAFHQFNTIDTVNWFESRGVPLTTYPDGCIFPKANTSQAIIDCFLSQVARLGISIQLSTGIDNIQPIGQQFQLTGSQCDCIVDRVIVTTGGQPKISGLTWIAALGHEVVDPVPSLFTFNMPGEPIRELMGTVVENATVKIEGSRLTGKGPLLITHWGMSGPSILQLSAWGARFLHDKAYECVVRVNWLDELRTDEVVQHFRELQRLHGEKRIVNLHPFQLTNRLWKFLLHKSAITESTKWKELGPKQENRLVNCLLNDGYTVKGKTTFKEEFVTAGGVALSDVSHQTMESKRIPGLFFAGEILDIDGITGGFNFQAAWTSGFIAGKNAAKGLN